MVFKNATIVLEDKVISNGFLQFDGNKITNVGEDNPSVDAIDLKGLIIMPGFIDVHIHGGFGYSFETKDKKDYQKLSIKLASEGITSYCLASVTNSDSDNLLFLNNFASFMQEQKSDICGSKCLGLHLEGPFISQNRKGAHDERLLQKPSIAKIEQLLQASQNNIKVVTYAPELQDGEFTRYLVSKNIIPSAGHSSAHISNLEIELLIGLNHVTHLFNGMDPIDHKNAGLVTFALLHDDVLCEVIADLIHLDKSTLKLIYKIKGSKGICLITDGTSATGMPDGEYLLGKLECIKQGNKMTTKQDGGIAGSVSTYESNVKNIMSVLDGLSLCELSHMTSTNVAKQLKIFDKTGSIVVGKVADLVVLDKLLNVQMTIVNGKIIYKKVEEKNEKN